MISCILVNLMVQTAAAGDVLVRVVDAPRRVFPEEIDLAGTDGAEVFCAKREAESFQIVVINRGPEPLNDIELTWTELSGPSGQADTAPTMTVFREHYVRIERPTLKSRAAGGSLYADALIPFRDPYTGRRPSHARYEAAGFLVPPGKCQPYWVDVTVPANAAAGVYEGKITVKATGFEADVPVKATVWDFQLPRVPSLNTRFGGIHRIADTHGVAAHSAHYYELAYRYLDMFAEHRINTYFPRAIRAAADGHAIIDEAEYLQPLRQYIEKYNPPRHDLIMADHWPFEDPYKRDAEKLAVYLADIDQMLERNPWIPPAYLYAIDEPSTKEKYDAVRTLGGILHDGKMSIKNMVTEEPRTEPGVGSIEDAVDVFVVQQRAWDPAKAAARKAAGKEVWSYTALVYFDKPCPAWQVDAPLLDYMVPFWTTWSTKLDGFVYWCTIYPGEKGNDPWRDLGTYKKEGAVVNGEGLLIYPGEAAGVDGPIASMRLKMIRDGLECYDYLRILSDLGGGDEADRVARGLSASFFEWDPDWHKYLRARRHLAEQIIAKKNSAAQAE